MEELEKEMSKIGNNEEELVQELRTLRESKHKQEESTCERHVKRIDEDRVNLDRRVIDASEMGKYAHMRKFLEFVVEMGGDGRMKMPHKMSGPEDP